MKNIYSIPPTPTEDHHGEIYDIHTIVQGMQTQSYDMEGMAQANAVLNSSNSEVVTQLAHMTVTMNNMQEKLNTLASNQTNQTSPKRKHYCWSCGRNYTHGSKTCS